MKILTVCSTADLFGGSRCMERVFGRLAEAGHEVHAVVPVHGPLVALLEARGVRVHVQVGLPVLDGARLAGWVGWVGAGLALPGSVWRLARLIRRLKVDVLHSNRMTVVTPSIAAWLTRTPHVWHVRAVPETGWGWGLCQRWMHFSSASAVAVSGYVARRFEPRYRDWLQVIYEGLEDEDGCEDAKIRGFRARFAADVQLVGVVGRIEWHKKGQEMLVRAASVLQERLPKVHYVFAGEALPGHEEHESSLRELVSTYGLDEAVTFVGAEEAAACVLGALDVAVVPPVVGPGFSFAVLDAMAGGTCVVGSRCGAIPEEIEDGVTGVLFKPGDFEELAKVIERLLGDKGLRERLVAAGRVKLGREFRLERTVREMEGALEGVRR